MSLGLIGKKIGMTRILTDDGAATPVTVINVQPNRIVQKKTAEKDGYEALQVTTGLKANKKGDPKIRRVSSAIKGHYAKASQQVGEGLWEVDNVDVEGNELTINLFGTGHFVDISGQSKGKGFQGGVKRHNFRMQDATHGNSISHRALGSTGQCQEPGRVFKGKKMAGHMGAETVTQQCLEVIRVDSEKNLLLVKGSVPGANNSFVKVSLSVKKTSFNQKISDEIKQQAEAPAETEVEATNEEG